MHNVPDDASNRIVNEKEEEEVNRGQLRISRNYQKSGLENDYSLFPFLAKLAGPFNAILLSPSLTLSLSLLRGNFMPGRTS